MTKQAAQKRFVPRSEESNVFAGNAFERFTGRSRQALVTAQEIARGARNEVVDVEHILLGLLDDPECMAVRAIVAQGATVQGVRDAAAATLPTAADEEPPANIPYTPRAKKLLQLTIREALRLGHNYVGTEHILLGLLSDDAPEGGSSFSTTASANRRRTGGSLAPSPPKDRWGKHARSPARRVRKIRCLCGDNPIATPGVRGIVPPGQATARVGPELPVRHRTRLFDRFFASAVAAGIAWLALYAGVIRRSWIPSRPG